MIPELQSDANIRQTHIELCSKGMEFIPFDQDVLFLFQTDTNSLLKCAQTCYTNNFCRTFNYDYQTKLCRLYEGDINSTGVVISSVSIQSVCGTIHLVHEDFNDYERLCSSCQNNRYLTCRNDSCQCQSHTYYDGSICRSQKLNGSACTNDIECRNDLNLSCLFHMQCGYDTDTIITPTTTITRCPNDLSCFAQWLFDGNYLDQMNNYNATPSDTTSFTTNGYVNQALIFPNNGPNGGNSMLTVPYIPLSNTSFTIDMWLYITSLGYSFHIGLLGLCSQTLPNNCLHILIELANNNYYLYFGFVSNDCQGVTSIGLFMNTWIHTTFVFDATTLTQKIYLNGILENTCSSSSVLTVTPTNVTIGFMPLIASTYNNLDYFQGYMDQLTISNRVKSSAEILELATLVAYFTFDNNSFLIDSGPNSLQATTQSTSLVSSGRYSQAITFTGSTASYFQVAGLVSLGMSTKPFSISLWIQPVSLEGTIIFVSTIATGCGWCVSFLGFTSNGLLAAQIYSGTYASIVSSTSISTFVWSHVVQTWSPSNGLRLYINSVLVASDATITHYEASQLPNYITLANTLSEYGASLGIIGSTVYQGDIDDFRIYSRELSSTEVDALYTN